MNRDQIEKITASLAVTFLGLVTLGLIIFLADTIFNWDIFPPNVEKALGFILISMIFIIASAVIVNIMINLSIIAEAAKRFLSKPDKS